MKTEVILTVDTEFTAGGYFEDPPQGKPVGRRCVDLEIDGRSQGLGFLLETLREHDVRATFFVEAAHVLHFGHEPMGGVVRELREAGHDIQLHLHPMWLACEKATTPEQIRAARTVDLMGELEPDQLRRLLTLGLEVFEQWGIERPVAVRAGNLSTSREVYRRMAEFDLPLASHVGVAYLPPKEPALALHAGRHRIEGVLELPVLTYRAFGTGLRLLTITSSSFTETRRLLEDAHRADVAQVVILTHCHEFVKRSDKTYARIARNRVNQKRLVQLCRYVRANPDRFATATFGERGPDWLELPPTGNPLLVGPALAAMRRMLANKVNDTFWKW